MARLIAALVRHGDYQQLSDTPSAHQPFPLTERGREQAARAVSGIRSLLQQSDWLLHPVIDSSQMQRAWQTAEILRLGLDRNMRIEAFDALAERGVGAAANLSVSEIRQIMAQDQRYPALPENWKADSHYRLPFQGAESLLDAGARVADHLERRMSQLTTEGQGGRVKLFVGHGAAIRHAAYHLGILAFEEIARLSMYHVQPVYLEYLPGNEWRHIRGDWKVRDRHEKLD